MVIWEARYFVHLRAWAGIAIVRLSFVIWWNLPLWTAGVHFCNNAANVHSVLVQESGS
jgi:hypothetical protein